MCKFGEQHLNPQFDAWANRIGFGRLTSAHPKLHVDCHACGLVPESANCHRVLSNAAS